MVLHKTRAINLVCSQCKVVILNLSLTQVAV